MIEEISSCGLIVPEIFDAIELPFASAKNFSWFFIMTFFERSVMSLGSDTMVVLSFLDLEKIVVIFSIMLDCLKVKFFLRLGTAGSSWKL